jgi:hypothetical protein
VIGNHFGMAAIPRCAALLRNGEPCGRTVASGSEFCVHHAKLLATVDAETMRRGRTPKKRALRESVLRVVPESTLETGGGGRHRDGHDPRPANGQAATGRGRRGERRAADWAEPVPVEGDQPAVKTVLIEDLGRVFRPILGRARV